MCFRDSEFSDGKTKFLSVKKSEFNEDNKIYKASAVYGPQLE